jgi:mRNA interferase MazF
MKEPTKIYERFDIVVVPFPFVDVHEVKHRPAIILSSAADFNSKAKASVMSMITSSLHTPWPCDIEITDLETAGLPVRSIIRLKLFTLDNRLIIKRIGRLHAKDQKSFVQALTKAFHLS